MIKQVYIVTAYSTRFPTILFIRNKIVGKLTKSSGDFDSDI